jgi:DNA polymerase/3'-5' exonuclease PolX
MATYIKAAHMQTLEAVLEYLERMKETEADETLLSDFRAYVEHCRALNRRNTETRKVYEKNNHDKVREINNRALKKLREKKRKQKQEEQEQKQ